MGRIKKRTNSTGNSNTGSAKKKRGNIRRRSSSTSAVRSGKVTDARLKLIAKNRSKIFDARDKLASLAKTTDARQKLKNIRNRKEGKADVKTTAKGGITITTKMDGKLVLTTAKKNKSTPSGKAQPNRNKVGSTNRPSNNSRPAGKLRSDGVLGVRDGGIKKRRSGHQVGNSFPVHKPHFRVRSTVEDPPHPLSRVPEHDRFERSSRQYSEHDDRREPLGRYGSGIYGKHVTEPDIYSKRPAQPKFAHLVTSAAETHVSPLQGTKVIVSNLQPTVTREDVEELFSDVGPLKRTKMPEVGMAEIVFVNKADAITAIEAYHNRQLDGKPMRVKIVDDFRSESYQSSTFSREYGGHAPPPDLTVVHRALFSDRPRTSGLQARQNFSVNIDNRRSGSGRSYRH